MSERELVCLSCGVESDSFLTECSNCGESHYRSRSSASESAEKQDAFESRLARLSRPVNPLVPA